MIAMLIIAVILLVFTLTFCVCLLKRMQENERYCEMLNERINHGLHSTNEGINEISVTVEELTDSVTDIKGRMDEIAPQIKEAADFSEGLKNIMSYGYQDALRGKNNE